MGGEAEGGVCRERGMECVEGERRTEERKVGCAEPLGLEGGRERRFVLVFVHVQLRHLGDDLEVEAVGIRVFF